MAQSSAWAIVDEKAVRQAPRVSGIALVALSFQTLGLPRQRFRIQLLYSYFYRDLLC